MKSAKIIDQQIKAEDGLKLLSKMLTALDDVNELNIAKLASKFFRS